MDKPCHLNGSDTSQGQDAATAATERNQCGDTSNNHKSASPPSNYTAANGRQPGAGTASANGGARTRLATLAQIGEDWLYLALLGTIMALLSFSMDIVITIFLNTRLWMFQDVSEDNILIQYVGWCLTPIVLVAFSTGFVHLCSPTAIGSGIPEMKTILRGVVLNEYLTFRTLIAKIVGLTFTLGSGLPLGKEGPFVHMASIVATLLSKLVASFQGIYENESRTSEMLSAACAVGVAATFYAPIGGVLFSIEVTTVYFAVRNYWRGFFAACCGATIWRLLGFWVKNDETISALFKTNFRNDFPFEPVDLLVYSFIGATCGLAGAAYIKFHREIVQFFRRHKRMSGFLQHNRFVYPILVTLIITTVTFPPGIGKYTAATLSTHTTIEHLFSNRTWSEGNQDLVSKRILDEWTTPETSFYVHLVLYIVMLFWTSALASTIPIPSGIFIPVLKMGAAYGRLLGELMHLAFPNGINCGNYVRPVSIIPGSYAVVGAAAFSGAVTHTISTSVILFEMTGQIVHIIPVILGVLIANAVCQSLQPSIYDSIIEIKKLPYLPPIASSNSVSHKILVKDFMNTNLAYVWKDKCTYADLKALLAEHKKILSFPLVESAQSMKLLGSVPRSDLLKLLYLHLGHERRLQEVFRRNSDTLSVIASSIHEDQGLEFKPRCLVASNNFETSRPASSTSNSNDSAEDSGGRVDAVICTDHTQQLDASELPNVDTLTPIAGANNQVGLVEPEGIAKLVNHYNRGTTMEDERQLKAVNEKLEALAANGLKTPARILIPAIAPQVTLEVWPPGQDPACPNDELATADLKLLPTVNELKPVPIYTSEVPLPPPPTTTTKDVRQAPPASANTRPTKSILKATSSSASMYRRNISSQSFYGSLNLTSQDVKRTVSPSSLQRNIFSFGDSTGMFNLEEANGSQVSTPVRHRRKVKLPRLRVVDMTLEEQEQWEKEQLNTHIDLSRCQIDEAPFQLVEQTSLYRVHTLFSMLGLNHAYVTSFGRLVGIVALKDIRYAIEKMLQEK